MVDDCYQLVMTKPKPPAVAIRTVEVHTVVAVRADVLVVSGEPRHVVAACEHPECFEDVKKRVGVTLRPQQHALPRTCIDCRDGFGDLGDGATTGVSADPVLP